ncbi:15447_t:CDS:2, partial [Dentiscutata heterogama]
SEDEFDEAELCFSSNIEMSLFDDILNSNGQLCSEESNSLTESEAETDLTDSEEGLYLLNKGQSFGDWKEQKANWTKTMEYLGIAFTTAPKSVAMKWKSDNQVHISGIIGKHSHPMSDNIQMTAPQY